MPGNSPTIQPSSTENRIRVYLANVGANSSHGQLVSPLFEDDTFELLPIPEIVRTREACGRTVRYRDLRSHYNPDQDLLQYVPQKMWDNACHNDPEFKTLTYGDNGTNGRSSALTQLREGDALLFIARLERRTASSRARHSGFYLIGGLLVAHAGFVTPNHGPCRIRGSRRCAAPPHTRLLVAHAGQKFSNNAHAIRGDPEFLGVAGSERSRRFQHGVPVTKEICDEVFRDKDGSKWTWGNGKSHLVRIGSYTRACRRMLDTADPEEKRRTAILRAWIEKHTGEDDASLMDAR